MEINSHLSDKAQHDANLVLKAQLGDQSAFAALMAKYWNPIYFMIVKMIPDKQDVEDLTIDTFGRAFKNIGQYVPTYAFSTWISRIASNNCIDFLRKKSKQGIIVNINDHLDYDKQNNYNLLDNTSKIKSDSLTPEELMINKQKKIKIRRLVQKLTPQYRKIIELRYFKELSYEEISKELNIKIDLVKVQIFRSKSLLTKILKESMSDEQ